MRPASPGVSAVRTETALHMIRSVWEGWCGFPGVETKTVPRLILTSWVRSTCQGAKHPVALPAAGRTSYGVQAGSRPLPEVTVCRGVAGRAGPACALAVNAPPGLSMSYLLVFRLCHFFAASRPGGSVAGWQRNPVHPAAPHVCMCACSSGHAGSELQMGNSLSYYCSRMARLRC